MVQMVHNTGQIVDLLLATGQNVNVLLHTRKIVNKLLDTGQIVCMLLDTGQICWNTWYASTLQAINIRNYANISAKFFFKNEMPFSGLKNVIKLADFLSCSVLTLWMKTGGKMLTSFKTDMFQSHCHKMKRFNVDLSLGLVISQKLDQQLKRFSRLVRPIFMIFN